MEGQGRVEQGRLVWTPRPETHKAFSNPLQGRQLPSSFPSHSHESPRRCRFARPPARPPALTHPPPTPPLPFVTFPLAFRLSVPLSVCLFPPTPTPTPVRSFIILSVLLSTSPRIVSAAHMNRERKKERESDGVTLCIFVGFALCRIIIGRRVSKHLAFLLRVSGSD